MAKRRELIIELRARTERFQQGLDEANNKLASFGKNTKSLLAGFGGLFAIGEIKNATVAAIDHASALQKDAEAAGLAGERYQQFLLSAGKVNVNTQQMSDALVEYNLRVGEARTGTGALAGFLENYDAQLLKNIQSAGSQSEALDLLFKKIKDTPDISQKLLIGDEAFGGEGAKIALLAEEYDTLAEAAEAAGGVLSNELLESAVDLDRRYNKLANTISTKLKTALLSTADFVTEFIDKVSGDFEIDSRIGEYAKKSEEELTALIANAEKRIKDFQGVQSKGFFGDLIDGSSDTAQREIQGLTKDIGIFKGALIEVKKSKIEAAAVIESDAIKAKLVEVRDIVGENIDKMKKYEDVLQDVKDEFKELKPETVDLSSSRVQAEEITRIYDSIGEATRKQKGGDFEGALKIARDARETIIDIRDAGGDVSAGLVNSVTEIAVAAAERLQEIAKATIEFDETQSSQAADNMLNLLNNKMKANPVRVPVQLEWTNAQQAQNVSTGQLQDMLPTHALKGGY